MITEGPTMQRAEIAFDEFNLNIFNVFNDSLILTAGTGHQFNSMTIGWGSIGVMWHTPVIMVGVRPTRYTFQFIEKSESFTVCGFEPQYKEVLRFMGTKSGRDVDKVKESGLTPYASSKIEAPGYLEANLILECKKTYFDDLNPAHCSDLVNTYYKNQDYHRIYIGEIVAIFGEPQFCEGRS
jgi:flavin reductase (DIM6/NTAB) family NADH-FMN oxidoreductase RutF